MMPGRSALAANALRLYCIVAAGMLALSTGVLAGSVDVQDALSALAAAERRARDTTLPLHERERAADRMIELRATLIEQADEADARLPEWLIEQAAALLARLSRDGSDTAVLVGIPLPEQREGAAETAREAAALLGRAMDLLPENPETLQDRTIRIPHFLARAEVLLAASTEGEARRGHAERAHELIGQIALSEVAPESVRRINFALALILRAGDPGDAEIALDEVAWILTREGEEARAVPPLVRAEAWMVLMHAGSLRGRSNVLLERFHEALEGPPFKTAGKADALLTVLAHDAATRAIFEQGLRAGDKRLLDLAIQQQARLLERTDLPMRGDALRPLVYEKLALLAEAAGRNAALPGAMQAARAVILARESSHRDEATEILQQVIAEDSAGPFAADALWELAVLLSQSNEDDDQLEAARVLTRLAEKHPEGSRASEAMAAALSLARRVVVERERGDVDRGRAHDAYARALEVATTKYPDLSEIDLWRYERARLLLEEYRRLRANGADLAKASVRLDTALESLGAVGADFATGREAARLTAHVHIARMEAVREQLRVLRREGRATETLAGERFVRLAREAVIWAGDNDVRLMNRFRIDLAEAFIESGGEVATGEARRVLRAALPGLEVEGDRELLHRASLLEARILLATGDPGAAFRQLREVVERLEPLVSTGTDHVEMSEVYWHAWTLMLETLAGEERGQGESRQGTIRLHIRRLKAIDADLGGEPWRRRILATSPDG